ncbi:glycosyltransferase family 4 protein [Streptomyces kronopolitis]
MTDWEVFGWQGDEGGCGYYRINLPMRGLESLGHAAANGLQVPVEVCDSPDTIVVGQRICGPASRFWQELASQDRKIVYDLDDDLWNVDATSTASPLCTPEVIADVQRNIEVATVVTVSTAPLAERVAVWNSNVHVVPNAVPDWLIDHQPQPRDDRITIGWGGTDTHNMDIEQIASQLRRFIQRNPGAEFHCIGSDYGSWMRLREDRTRFTPWVPGIDAFLRTIDYHIGIAPLRPHIFNQSKSALKAMECGALGIPVVASAVRPYEDYVRHGETGYLVRRDHEWGQYLRALTEDADLRISMGLAARRQAAQHTITQVAPLWEKAIFG